MMCPDILPSFRERLVLYALLTSLTSLSVDALLPGLRDIGAEFSASPQLSTQHVISLFVFGMAFGELLLGPFSDATGRKTALLAGLGIYMAGTVVAMTAGSLEMVVLGRFLQGIGVAGPKIATRAMIRDQFEGDAMARVMSFMFTLFILVPMIAPALAQGLILTAGWRSVFAAYLVIAVLLGLWLGFRQPETLEMDRRIPFSPRLLFLNSRRILRRRHVTCLIIATGLVFGAQLFYIGTAVDLFADAYGITTAFPLYFALLATSFGLASLLNARLVQRFGMHTMARCAFVWMVAAASAMAAVSLAYGDQLPFALFMAFLYLLFFAIGILFGNLNAMAMQSLGHMAGLGASLIASGSSVVATIFAVAAGAFPDGSTLHLSLSFLLAGAISLILAELAARSDVSPIQPVKAP